MTEPEEYLIKVIVLLKTAQVTLAIEPDNLGGLFDHWNEQLEQENGSIGGPDAQGNIHLFPARQVNRIVCIKAQPTLKAYYLKQQEQRVKPRPKFVR